MMKGAQFEHLIILRIRQMPSPEKMDPTFDALREKIVQEIADLLWREQPGPPKDILILQAERW